MRKLGGLAGGRELPEMLLQTDEAQVWRIGLDPPPGRLAELDALLSAGERQRAERFAFPHLRRRFVVARGALRTILGRYLELTPEAIRFRYAPRGKPALAEPPESPLRFNLSHSHELAVCAVTLGREVGVDVEWVERAGLELERLAAAFFSPTERAVLAGLPESDRAVAFFDCWTRKEAYLKARGEGLAIPLAAFDVSLAPGAPAALLAGRGLAADVGRWRLHPLELGPGYRAALAVEGSVRVRRFDFGEPDGR